MTAPDGMYFNSAIEGANQLCVIQDGEIVQLTFDTEHHSWWPCPWSGGVLFCRTVKQPGVPPENGYREIDICNLKPDGKIDVLVSWETQSNKWGWTRAGHPDITPDGRIIMFYEKPGENGIVEIGKAWCMWGRRATWFSATTTPEQGRQLVDPSWAPNGGIVFIEDASAVGLTTPGGPTYVLDTIGYPNVFPNDPYQFADAAPTDTFYISKPPTQEAKEWAINRNSTELVTANDGSINGPPRAYKDGWIYFHRWPDYSNGPAGIWRVWAGGGEPQSVLIDVGHVEYPRF